MSSNSENIKDKIKDILFYIGDDPEREGLIDTPKRIIKAWEELYQGYKQNPKDILRTTFNEGRCEELVVLKDIEFYSTCEHHMLPFYGTCHIGYIPNDKIVGISKLARLVECFSRRLQIQERLSGQIADSIQEYLNAKGSMVVMEAQHFCMTSRGIKKQKSKMITSAIRGVFKMTEVRTEFLKLVEK